MTAYVSIPRSVVEELTRRTWTTADATLLADLFASLERQESRSASRPPWANAANGIRELRRLVDERGPKAVAELDQLRGTIRDELDKLEVSLYDEHAIYLGMVWTALVTELARHGYHNAAIDSDTYKAVAEIAATIASALLEYVPREVLEP